MATYYVDDGGSATDPYDTWAKAALSLAALDDAKAFAAGDIVYVGHNSVSAGDTAGASRTITGPAGGPPMKIISATQGSSPPTYAKSTTNQIVTTAGAFSLTFNGFIALYGIRAISGANIIIGSGNSLRTQCYDCTFAPAANGSVSINAYFTKYRIDNLSIDLTADGSTNRSASVIISDQATNLELNGLTFVNAAFRTGTVIGGGQFSTIWQLTGCDFSGFTNATLCEIFSGIDGSQHGPVFMSNCKMASTWSPWVTGSWIGAGDITLTNCGPSHAPTYLTRRTANGYLISSTVVTRTGGAAVEGTACSWNMNTTTSTCGEGDPFVTPWIYGTTTAASRTFDIYIVNDTADFTDAEVWIEVEYLATSGSPLWTIAKDQRADILATAAAQTDDVTSVWTGAGPAYTYMQKLSKTVTVGQSGQFRARVAVGVASIASGRNFYIDPKVAVT